MSVFSAIVLGGVVLLVLAAISPPARRFFKAVGLWGGAQADKSAEAVLNADPLGVLKTQIANAAENGKQANTVVEAAAKQLVSLENQIADDLKEQQRLTTRIQSVLAKGDPNGNAPKYAADLARVEEHLKVNQEQKVLAQEQYDDNLKLVERFEREIQEARKDASDLGLQLQQSEAEKNLHRMSAALKDKLSVGDLAEARQRVKDQINANRGSAKASRDLNRVGLAEEEDEELERSAAADAVLARFQKKDDGPAAPAAPSSLSGNGMFPQG
jgi:phage shock protein A